MLKLGMKPVTGVSRVTIKRTKNVNQFLCFLTKFRCVSAFMILMRHYINVARYSSSSLNRMSSKARIQKPMLYSVRPRSRI